MAERWDEREPSLDSGVESTGPAAPPRPRNTSAAELGFQRQEFVRWFHPVELARAGVRTVLATMFGAYADKRELQAALSRRAGKIEYDYSVLEGEASPGAAAERRSEIWLDFVADVGDGFNATYAVASLLAREELELAAHDGIVQMTRRGALLVMGGDEVYPTASRVQYEQRTIGPYRAALPFVAPAARPPHLFAIPGNHDWYDGLSAFLRQFTQRRWVGGWLTQQERSYFVLKLPHGVWLWGIDIQLHADVDGPQLAYFQQAADALEPGARVILCTAEPSWVEAARGKCEGYRNLAFVESKVLARGARVVLVLTGDSHHYARYRELTSGRAYVTAGGGGAFLHGTHALPRRIELSEAAASPLGGRAEARTMHLERAFPEPPDSVAHVKRVLRFSLRNRGFAIVWAVLWLLLGWALFSASVGAGAPIHPSSTLVGTLARWNPLQSGLTQRPWLWGSLAGIVLFAVLIELLLRSSSVPQHDEREGREADITSNWRRLPLELMLCLAVATVPAVALGAAPFETLLATLARSPAAVLLLLLLVCAAMVYVTHSRLRVRVAVGVVHACAHVLTWLLIATITAAVLIPLQTAQPGDGILVPLESAVLLGGWLMLSAELAGIASATIFGFYLWFAGRYLPEQLDDVFSALGVEDFKNFVRLHVGADGVIRMYAVGIRSVPKQWKVNSNPSDGAPFLVPEQEGTLKAELIEPAVRL